MPYKFKIGDRVTVRDSDEFGWVDGINTVPGQGSYWVNGVTRCADELEAAPAKTRKKRGAK